VVKQIAEKILGPKKVTVRFYKQRGGFKKRGAERNWWVKKRPATASSEGKKRWGKSKAKRRWGQRGGWGRKR